MPLLLADLIYPKPANKFTHNSGPVDKSKISAEARSGPDRTVNLETEKDGIYHSFKV